MFFFYIYIQILLNQAITGKIKKICTDDLEHPHRMCNGESVFQCNIFI